MAAFHPLLTLGWWISLWPILAPYRIDCVDAPGVGITAQSEANAIALLQRAFGENGDRGTFLASMTQVSWTRIMSYPT
jgi:hypothetical protein